MIALFVLGIILFAIFFPKDRIRGLVADVASDSGGPVAWSDTLTNHSSACPALDGMGRDITAFMQRFNLAGMQIAIMRHDSLLFTQGYGMADREAGIEMDASHMMRIASVSKLVTAAAVMRLVEQGKLSLDSKVTGSDGILNDKDLVDAIADERLTDLTVDNLLQHMGGFSNRKGDPMFNIRDIVLENHLTSPPTPREIARIVFGRRLAAAPGVRRSYSNFGYMLLSLVIEKVSGKSYWDYVNEDVLRPAGAPAFQPATNYYDERGDSEVKYYAADDEIVEEYNGSDRMVPRAYGGNDYNALMGGGGWVASAAGLARLVASIDLDPGVTDIISARSVALLTETDPDEKVNLSRGWAKIDKGGKWIRTGTLSSSHALIDVFPDGQCWILLTNSGVWTGPRFSSDMQKLVNTLRQRYSKDLPARDLFSSPSGASR